MSTSLRAFFGRQNLFMTVSLLCAVILIRSMYGSKGKVERMSIHPTYKTGKRETEGITSNIDKKTSTVTLETGLDLCDDTRVMPRGTFPPIALASYPGSGNTWVRYLIETATGYATGSVYSSRILKKQGFIGEKERPLSGTTPIFKTHKYNDSMVAVVLLVRNPYRAMISEYNRRNADKTSHAKEEQFKTRAWRGFVKYEARRWIRLNQRYISSCHRSGMSMCKSILVVYYEQLKVHLIQELRRIIEFLSLNVDEERLACVLANAEGAFHRPKRNQTFDPFTEEMKLLVGSSMTNYVDAIDKAGLESPPLSFTLYPDSF